MLSKTYLEIIFILLLTYFGECQCQPNCSLELVNKAEFVKSNLQYLDENSRKWMLHFDLDFSKIEDFDLANKTSLYVFRPTRWYRSKDRAVERLLLFYQKYLFESLLVVSFKNIKVKVKAEPVGCLNNIDEEDMAPFIRNFLLDDFGIKVDQLRTSTKLDTNAEICSAYFDNNQSTMINYRCCGYDIQNIISCRNITLDGVEEFLLIIVAVLVYIAYLFSPLLFHKHDYSSSRIWKYIASERNVLKYSRLICTFDLGNNKCSCCFPKCCCCCLPKCCGCLLPKSYNIERVNMKLNNTEPYMKNVCKFVDQLTRSEMYSAQVLEVDVEVNTKAFMTEDQYTFYSLSTFFYFFFYDKSSAVKSASSSKWKRLIIRLLLFFVIFTIPSCVYFYFDFLDKGFQYDLDKALIRRGLLQPNYSTIKKHFLIGSISINQIIFCIFTIVDIFIWDDSFNKSLLILPERLKLFWQSIFETIKFIYSDCCPCLLLLPIVFPVLFFFGSPMIMLMFIICTLNMEDKKRCTLRKFFYYCFAILILLISLLIWLPAVLMYCVFVVVVAIFMFEATAVLPILSAITALLVNLKIFSNFIGEKHNTCLKSLVHYVECKRSPSNEAQSSETTLLPLIEPVQYIIAKHDRLYLKIKKSLAFISENQTIKVNKSAIQHCMRHLYIQALIGFIVIVAFLSAVTSVVFVLGRFDYITTSNQVFATFITGVLPALFLLTKTGFTRNTSTLSTCGDQKDDIASKLESYSEEYLIQDMKLTDINRESRLVKDYFIINLQKGKHHREQQLIDDNELHENEENSREMRLQIY